MLWKGFQKPKRLAVDTSTLTDKTLLTRSRLGDQSGGATCKTAGPEKTDDCGLPRKCRIY
jgi:hypothetical protein